MHRVEGVVFSMSQHPSGRRPQWQQEEEDDKQQNYVFWGTQLFDETESRAGQHAKDVRDLGAQRSLPVWKQEVTDEQGRRRFHGAFEGGFSAGHYNTVGSVEGFQPAAFHSSRSERAKTKPQNLESFLDVDELEEREKVAFHVQCTSALLPSKQLHTAGIACRVKYKEEGALDVQESDYDTFGTGAAEAARWRAQQEANKRPSLIPGPALDDLVVPVADSIGMRLLQRMGWRPGRGIGSATASRGASASKWGTVAGVSLENTPVYVLQPKQDVHGLGFDPFADAEEFRSAKRQRAEQAKLRMPGSGTATTMADGSLRPADAAAQAKRARGIAFGTGALEETDTLGYLEDYADHSVADDDEDGAVPGSGRSGMRQLGRAGGKAAAAIAAGGSGGGSAGGGGGPRALALTARAGYSYELASDEEDDEDRFTAKRNRPGPLLLTSGPGAGPQHLLQARAQRRPEGSSVAGFARSQHQLVAPAATLPLPPDVPASFVAHHVFPGPPAREDRGAAAQPPPPQEMAPPEDAALKRQVDSLAAQVARSGAAVEALARRQAGQPGGKFSFLLDGPGAQYYAWRLYKIKAALEAAALRPSVPLQPAGALDTPHPPPVHRRQALTIEQRMALLGEAPLASSTAAAAALDRAHDLAGQPAGQPEGQQQIGAQVAASDKARLQDALQSSFVAAASQDMQLEGQQQYGLRPGANPKLPPAAAAAVAAFANRFSSGSTAETSVLPPAPAAGLQQPAVAGATMPAAAAAAAATALAAAAETAERPVRTAEDWRPEPLLCRRLNVPDPYHGKPQPQQMSKFKSDYVALPDTTAAIIAAAQATASTLALPPPPPLPPPPLQHALPPPPPMPTDAKILAANFLASLDYPDFGGGAPPVPGAASPTALRAAPVASGGPLASAGAGRPSDSEDATLGGALDKPLDLFKAIFEASEEGEDEEAEEAAQEPLRAPLLQPAQPAPAEAADVAPAAAPVIAPSTVPTAASRVQERARGLADALMQAQEVSAVKAAEARAAQAAAALSRQQSSMAAGPSGNSGYSLSALVAAYGAAGGTAPAAGGAAAGPDAATQQRIREALGMLKHGSAAGTGKVKKEQKKHKKHKHKRERGADNKGHKSSKRTSSKHSSEKKRSSKRRRDEDEPPPHVASSKTARAAGSASDGSGSASSDAEGGSSDVE